MATLRVTVTLPEETVREIDRMSRNRSRFVLDAVGRELEHRRREALRRSLANPHPESESLADEGLDAWRCAVSDDDVEGLLDPAAGSDVRWVPGSGWEAPGP